MATSGIAIIALAGLLGQISGLQLLGRIRTDYIPIAPSTSVCFLIFSSALFNFNRKSSQGFISKVMTLLVFLTTVFCLLEFSELFAGIDINFSNRLFPPRGVLGTIPIGLMSPATAVTFSISGLGILSLLLRKQNSRSNNLVSCTGGLTLLVGSTVLLAYLYGTPLMYSGGTVPMAATTAIAFLLLGIALVASTGPESISICNISGGSTSAVLMRAFLPLTLTAVLLQSAI